MKKVKVVESKIIKRDGYLVEKYIFSNNKTAYINLDTGEEEPDPMPILYVDLIDEYNEGKDVKVVESKIIKRDGYLVEKYIFSNNKIVERNPDTGELYPYYIAESYSDLIDEYNELKILEELEAENIERYGDDWYTTKYKVDE